MGPHIGARRRPGGVKGATFDKAAWSGAPGPSPARTGGRSSASWSPSAFDAVIGLAAAAALPGHPRHGHPRRRQDAGGRAGHRHRARRAGRRRARRRRSAGTRRRSARASSTSCARRCSTRSSGCRSPSSPARRPGALDQPPEQRRHRRPERGHRHARVGGVATSSCWSPRWRRCSCSSGGSRCSRSWCCRCSSSRPSGSGRALQRITREQMDLNAQMNTQMTERFNVAGALLVKLFGRHERRAAAFSAAPRRCATSASGRRMYGRVFFVALGLVGAMGAAAVYGVGAFHGDRRRRSRSARSWPWRPTPPGSTNRSPSLTNARVDLMTALVSFERVFEVLDAPVAIEDRPGAVDLSPRPAASSSTTSRSATRRPSTVSIASLETPGGATASRSSTDEQVRGAARHRR